MIELIAAIIKDVKDPFLIFVVLVMVGQFYLLLKERKANKELQVCINTNLAELNETTMKLVTLVEVLVYGRARNGNP